ncbi:MAG TPA: AMP-binding protein [Candidatus Mcinerneyibacterium sp.]|nr:AMP-binding protein [Candidatus Mcinerneyibacterium sp.]
MINKNFNNYFENLIKKYWNHNSMNNYGEETVKYSDVAGNIKYWHYIFKKLNIKKNDKIAILGPNSINWSMMYVAITTYGAIVVPILKEFHVEDIHHILRHSESNLFFSSEKIYNKLELESVDDLNMVFSIEDFSLLEYKDEKYKNNFIKYDKKYKKENNGKIKKKDFSIENSVQNDDIGVLVYTSGTTGFSKGVLLPYKSLLANIFYAKGHIELKEKDRVLSFLPLAHAYGCAFDFLFPFAIGVHITFLSSIPSPKILLKAFNEVKPQLINLVPLILEKMYKKRIKPKMEKGIVPYLMKLPVIKGKIEEKVKNQLSEAFGNEFINIVIGGAPLDPEIEKFFKKIGLRFSVGYGMTECAPLISYDKPETIKLASVGKVMDYLEIRIDSEDPKNIPGEIQVKGVNVMEGYYKNKKATEETFTDDGWLKTGDLGLIDEDGYIFIKGRIKNLILGPSGQNIYPKEIESKLNNLEFIEESLVYGVDNTVNALVYPDYDKLDEVNNENLDPQDFLKKKMEENRKKMNEILPSYSRIKNIKLHPESFEKTPTKKIKRYLYKNY